MRVEDLVGGIISVLEELHKLVKSPHQQIVYWENLLHQALLQAQIGELQVLQ